jgi:hypothetical protein
LAKKWGDEYAEMFKRTNTEYVRLSTLEREMMGWDHAEAGAILAGNWGLGENISNAVSRHVGEVSQHNHTCEPTLAGITALSGLLPKVPDQEWFEALNFVDAFRGMFGHKLADIFTILCETDTLSNQLAELIHLGNIPKSLNKFWQETLGGYFWTGAEKFLVTEEQLDEIFPKTTQQPEQTP